MLFELNGHWSLDTCMFVLCGLPVLSPTSVGLNLRDDVASRSFQRVQKKQNNLKKATVFGVETTWRLGVSER